MPAKSRAKPAATPGDPAPGALNPDLTVNGDTPPDPAAPDVQVQPQPEAPEVPASPAGPLAADNPETPAIQAEAAAAPVKDVKGKPGRPPKAPAEPGLCVHGCGLKTQRPQAKFVRGHDSLLAKELRAAYASGEKTAAQVREHAALISVKFAGKLEKSIAAVDAERKDAAGAASTRKALLAESKKVAAKSAAT